MRKNSLQVDKTTLERLKVLGAQIGRSPESTVAFLMDHFDSAVDRDFERTFGKLGGRVYLSGRAHQRLSRSTAVTIGGNGH